MRILLGVTLATILISVFVFSYRKTKDLFSPLCVFSLFQFLRYVPHIITTDYESLTNLNETNIFVTFVMETLFVVFVVLGYRLIKGKGDIERENKKQNYNSPKIRIPLCVILLVYLAGLGSRLYIIHHLGGLSYVLNNMGEAYYTYAHESNGYISSLGHLMTLGVLMLVYRISIDNKKRYYVLLASMVGMGMFSYMVYSSRSPALELLMITVFGYHFMVKKIKISSLLKPPFLMGLLFVVAAVCILPALRGNSKGAVNGTNFFAFFYNSLGNLFSEFSNVGRDTFVYQYFNVENFWYGLNFLNLFVAAIPSSIFLNKPCIDDGNYLSNLINGYVVSPNAGRNDLVVKYSIPFSTPGCMYANFGIVGIVLAGLLLGLIYKKAYKHLNKKVNPFTVFLYQLIVYQLEFSTLSISQVVIPLVVSGVVYWLSTSFFVDKKYALRRRLA